MDAHMYECIICMHDYWFALRNPTLRWWTGDTGVRHHFTIQVHCYGSRSVFRQLTFCLTWRPIADLSTQPAHPSHDPQYILILVIRLRLELFSWPLSISYILCNKYFPAENNHPKKRVWQHFSNNKRVSNEGEIFVVRRSDSQSSEARSPVYSVSFFHSSALKYPNIWISLRFK